MLTVYVLTGVAASYYIALISAFRFDYKNEMEILAMKLICCILRDIRPLIVCYAQFPFLQVVSDCISLPPPPFLSSCLKVSQYSTVLFSAIVLVESNAVSL